MTDSPPAEPAARLARNLLVASIVAIGCAGGPSRPAPATDGAAGPRVREPVDTVGYTHTAEGIEAVIAHALEAEKHRFAEIAQTEGVGPDDAFVAAISPHDDYRYASRVYVHVYPHIEARHLVMIGVAHKARDYPEVEGKLVLDSYDGWRAPYGVMRASPLREDLLAALDDEDAIVHHDLHAIEHSVEGMVPFAQHFDRDAQMVPVLVPYMSWDRLVELSGSMAAALDGAMERRGLALGEDVAILISSDSVHYGDEGWGGKDFADFGTDLAGYDRAVGRDIDLVGDHLVGEISLEKLEGLYRSLVADDFHEYRISWCGRFSVPFGVSLLHQMRHPPGRNPPRGVLLRYGTTLDPGVDDPGVAGLGLTAPANLRHWVGFAAIGYL